MNPLASTLGSTGLHAAPAAARQVLRLLERLSQGTLDLQAPDGARLRLGSGTRHASVQLHDWSVFAATLKSGDIGLAETYIDGRWDTPDLPGLLTLLLAHRDELERVVYGAWWGRLLQRLRHLGNRNTRRGSARNIHAHYDLGNAFYALWLDETMSYSGASFEGDPARPLAEAQRAKMRRALAEAGAVPGARVLEVGCGWGGLAQIAAGEFGAQVTGVTLSTEQLAWAQRRVAAAGLAPRCELRLLDYRDLSAAHAHQPFDAIVSIEMFEAVGREYWAEYFEMLRRCLKPGGRACIQSITIRDDLFDRYVRSTDFIQQYIFPGGLLPSGAAFEAAAGAAGFEVVRRLSLGLDYARTLHHWRAAFLAREREVLALGFDARFMRTWNFYLAYCEAAFTLHNTDVVQFTLQRDGEGWHVIRLAAAALWLLLGAALATAPAAAPAEVAATLTGARQVGSGVMRYFGFEVYEARLWAGAEFAPQSWAEQPFALELLYARPLDGAAIAQRSIEEMRRAGPLGETEARVWTAAMTAAFPDVRAGDRLVGTHDPRAGTQFFHNGRRTAGIADPAFAARFFGIWLSPTTSAPALRERLLGGGGR